MRCVDDVQENEKNEAGGDERHEGQCVDRA